MSKTNKLWLPFTLIILLFVILTLSNFLVLWLDKNGSPILLFQPMNMSTLEEAHSSSPPRECFASPYVNCSECTANCVVRREYLKKYGQHDRLKLNLNILSLHPGLTTSRTEPYSETFWQKLGFFNWLTSRLDNSKSTFRVAFFNDDVKTKSFSNCPFSNCQPVPYSKELLLEEDVKAVVVVPPHSWLVKQHHLQLDYSHDRVYVMAGRDTPVNYNMNISHTRLNGVFNLTATYRRDADIFVPLYGELQYVPDNSKVNITDVLSKKTKTAMWITSNCNTPSRRMQYVREMKKYVDVDIFGRCGERCSKGSKYGDGPLEWCHSDDDDKEYLFYLSFENSDCKDYVSEKFFKVFKGSRPLVPVVRGAADYDVFFPPGSFINANHFEDAKSLALYLKHLSEHLDEYSGFLKAKLEYTLKEVRASYECDLCEYLNRRDVTVRRMYTDMSTWLDRGHCGNHMAGRGAY